MLIETHAHLDFSEYNNDRADVIKRAAETDIGVIINVSSSLKGCLASAELSRDSSCIYAACGIHPHNAKEATDEVFDRIREIISASKKVVALGEVGLDFYKTPSPKEVQYDAFVKFIKLSKELDLPLILHCREESIDKKDAANLIIKTLRENLTISAGAVLHCFSGDKEFLKEALDLGLYISYTCNITFKNAYRLREVVKETPIERLLLETDCPFLAPQVKRGQRNEPAYLVYLVEALAEIMSISRQDIERITTENAKRLFNLC